MALSFRTAFRREESAVACATDAADGDQIPPIGRNEKLIYSEY